MLLDTIESWNPIPNHNIKLKLLRRVYTILNDLLSPSNSLYHSWWLFFFFSETMCQAHSHFANFTLALPCAWNCHRPPPDLPSSHNSHLKQLSILHGDYFNNQELCVIAPSCEWVCVELCSWLTTTLNLILFFGLFSVCHCSWPECNLLNCRTCWVCFCLFLICFCHESIPRAKNSAHHVLGSQDIRAEGINNM